ncbi:MAG: hypothetical protein QXI32_05520 [Candidatus Bathyarchaeia archaeon]
MLHASLADYVPKGICDNRGVSPLRGEEQPGSVVMAVKKRLYKGQYTWYIYLFKGFVWIPTGIALLTMITESTHIPYILCGLVSGVCSLLPYASIGITPP